ncbi:MAG: hypothetical protein WCC12_12070 [Anaerolineales bacterium]
MTRTRKLTQAVLSFIVILSMALPLTQTQSAAAQEGDGVRKQVNSESGKVSFIGPESGRRSVSSRTLGSAPRAQAVSPAESALSLVKRFAPEFGVSDPGRDLTEMRTTEGDNGRLTVRYQQNYQGIPVIGGELVVNTNQNGDLYSMNGEVSQDLSLDTQPNVTVEDAIETAKQGMVKWYGGTTADYQHTQAALWIFDEQLLRPSIRPAELVWRLEMTTVQQGQPIREMVLVNAETGNIPLHFNQIDNAWGGSQAQDPEPAETPTPLPTEPPVVTDDVSSVETPLPRETAIPTDKLQESNSWNEGDVTASGVIWYVATTGNDANSCSVPELPCLTIQAAVDKALSGDVIYIANGTYTSANTYVVNISKSLWGMGRSVFGTKRRHSYRWGKHAARNKGGKWQYCSGEDGDPKR